jgi:hypothetical protein
MALLLTGGCGPAQPPVESFVLEVEFTAEEITLSHSPNEIAKGLASSRPMELEWEFGSLDLESVGSIGDIRLHGDKGLVIADGISDQVLLLDGPGTTPRHIVGPGPGPGETGLVYAVLSTGSHIVTWGASLSRAFQVFEEDGAPRASVPIPVPGDWTFALFRHPPMVWEPVQMTVEYISDRLVRLDSDHFVHILQDDERRKPNAGVGVPIEDLWTSAILYNLDAEVVDTIARYPAPRTRYTEIHGTWTAQDMYAGRLRVSGSEHHVAVTHGDSAHVRIVPRDPTGETIRWIRWPSFRPPLGPDAVQYQADLQFDIAMVRDPGFVLLWRQASRARRAREMALNFDRLNVIPDAAPEIMNIWSDGSCVFLSGFMYPDSYDGTSSRILGIDLSNETHEVLEVEQPMFRIRDVHRGRVLVTMRAYDDTWSIQVYRHGLRCA